MPYPLPGPSAIATVLRRIVTKSVAQHDSSSTRQGRTDPMGSSLDGTVALVTGASSGIGAATAHHLADNGATVALFARRKDRLDTLGADIEESSGTAFAVEADIGDR